MILGQAENKKYIKLAVEKNKPALLIGHTGTGKTSLIKEVARAYKKTLTRVNLNGQTSVDEFIGRYLFKDNETVWIDGVLTRAMKEGTWIVVDEINAGLPEILFSLHSLLDDDRQITLAEKDGEVIKPHKDFRFFATMNPTEEYTGTKELNRAFLSRFELVIEFDYPDKDTEIKILTNATKIGKADATAIVGLGIELRKLRDKGELYFLCSTRDLIQWATLTKHTNLHKAFELAILNKSGEDKEQLKLIYLNAIGHRFSDRDYPRTDTLTELFKLLDKKEADIEEKLVKLEKLEAKLNDKMDIAIKKVVKGGLLNGL